MILMTLDLDSSANGKRTKFYEALVNRGWTKVTRPKLTTTFRRDNTSDADVAVESIKAAAAAEDIAIHLIDYALLAGDAKNYRDY